MTSPRPFVTTRWSMVVAASDRTNPEGRAALEELCEIYWYPLYAYTRRSGSSASDAQDLTQGFFATLVEKDYLKQADQARGRFRAFLLTSFRHFVANEREAARAVKRGGGRMIQSLDFEAGESRYRNEPQSIATPERVYERRWALTLLERVLEQVRADFERRDKSALFTELRQYLTAGSAEASYGEVAARLGMDESAVKVAVHRLRRTYREALRAEIAHTVGDPGEVDDEIRHLIASVAAIE